MMKKNKDYIVFLEKELKKRKRGQWTPLIGKCGVYTFLKKNEPIYIGRTSNLYTRLIFHFSNGGICNALDFDEIFVYFTEDYKSLERKMIKYFKPPFNGRLTSRIYKRY